MNKADIKALLSHNQLLCVKKMNKAESDTRYNYDFIYYLLNYFMDVLVDKGKKEYIKELQMLDIKKMQCRGEYWFYLLTYYQYENTVAYFNKLKEITINK